MLKITADHCCFVTCSIYADSWDQP
jgi:hypothetical protein